MSTSSSDAYSATRKSYQIDFEFFSYPDYSKDSILETLYQRIIVFCEDRFECHSSPTLFFEYCRNPIKYARYLVSGIAFLRCFHSKNHLGTRDVIRGPSYHYGIRYEDVAAVTNHFLRVDPLFLHLAQHNH